MAHSVDTIVDEAIAESAHRLTGASDDYEPLFRLIGNARFVLLGEATHGTHDFYAERARITRALIERFGFSAVAVEADWPDAYRVNRYIRGQTADRNGRDTLRGFARFPTWMWRNTDVLAFVEWLRTYNDAPRGHKVGFYGLDLYSLYTSIDAVLHYLQQADPESARLARRRYACFDHFDRDSERYAYTAGFGAAQSCEDEVVAQLAEMLRRGTAAIERTAERATDEHFYALQNARLVKNAEEYYRTMFRGRVSSWNLRDRHMAQTLEALEAAHLSRDGPAKFVVWEHNSHVGDARATQMGAIGEWTLGQLVRERNDAESVLIGFTTHHGTVIAASDWGGPAERKQVRPALPESYEDLFHRAGIERFLLPLSGDNPAARGLRAARLERAIGVIYLPETERASHYFNATLPRQFDAVIHCDETSALQPLEPVDKMIQAPSDEAPEAYPTGL